VTISTKLARDAAEPAAAVSGRDVYANVP
jgi:hypothetical protein